MITNDNKSILSYERVKNGKKITVVVNLSNKEQTVKYDKKISKGNILLMVIQQELSMMRKLLLILKTSTL